MKTRLILKPGQKGTKGLTEKYGDALVCVRFRYDAELKQRLKTVELVVERTSWTPPPQDSPLTLWFHFTLKDMKKIYVQRQKRRVVGGIQRSSFGLYSTVKSSVRN